MKTVLRTFLDSFGLENTPLLLALSGGPDSMSLFYLLFDLKQPFEVAHLDHGWRDKSAREGAELEALCQEREIPFHCRRMQLEGSNLEERSRDARHAFFQEICAEKGLNGVVLGHHADDQAETVLKRLFEGASLPKLQGLAPKKVLNGLTYYRPLLNVRKKEVMAWLDERNLSYFSDPTNSDPRFLRSRMREILIPTLSKQFGKEVAPNLCKLGATAAELAEWMEECVKPYRQNVVENGEGVTLDLNKGRPSSSFLLKAVVRDLFERERLVLSSSVLETVLFHLQRNSSSTTLKVGKKRVEIDRGLLTVK